jgi:hypothetical protein
MTSLELTLANILHAIELAKDAGNVSALAALVHRKNTICAALAAPEQSWHMAHAQEPIGAARQRDRRDKVLQSSLEIALV